MFKCLCKHEAVESDEKLIDALRDWPFVSTNDYAHRSRQTGILENTGKHWETLEGLRKTEKYWEILEILK